MGANSYFSLFQKPPGTTAQVPRQTTLPQQQQQQPAYGSTPGVQAPAPYQPTSYPNPYPTAPTQPISPKLQQQIAAQQARMGNAGNSFAPNTLVRAKDLGWYDINQQLMTQQQSEMDRQKAYEEYQRAWLGLGQSPEALKAKELAMQAAMSGGPWTGGLMEQGRGAIRNTGSMALQGAQRTLAEDLARRGMGGSSIQGLNQARLGQQTALGIQQQLAQFEQQAAMQNEAARQAALAQLSGLAGTEQAQRLGLDTALAELYANTQRQPVDTSVLAEAIKKGNKVL